MSYRRARRLVAAISPRGPAAYHVPDTCGSHPRPDRRPTASLTETSYWLKP